MRLYGAIEKVEPQDDGTVRVHGIATSETVDDQGEMVRAEAIRAALPDYMRFPALREMHQLSAAGTTLEAEVGGDGITRIVAHVVDPVAVAKVKNQVYRGFSIGGRVTQREVGNPKVITGLFLSEISLVDRPANPAAVFDCWKAAAISGGLSCETVTDRSSPALDRSAKEPFNPPVQIWACGVPGHHHRVKSEAVKCLETWSLGAEGTSGPQSEANLERLPQGEREAVGADAAIADAGGNGAPDPSPQDDGEVHHPDAGDQADREQCYPVDSEAERVAAWKEKIDSNGPPSVETGEKPSCATMTGNLFESERAARVIQELDWLRDALDVETPMAGGDLLEIARLRANIAELCGRLDGLVAEDIGKIPGDMHKSPRRVLPKQPQGNQALMAGPAATAQASVDTAGDALRLIAKVGGSRSQSHQDLMDIAHECIGKVIDGISYSRLDPRLSCKQSAQAGEAPNADTWHSEETIDHLRSAHRSLVAAGALCNCGVEDAAEQHSRSSGLELEKVWPATDLVKVLAEERAEKAALVRAFGEVMPMLDRLSKRIDDIACTPLPPLTIARNSVSISKQQDGGGTADIQLSPEAVACALSKMTKEDQTLTLIKASYAKPIRVHGTAPGEP